MICRPQQRETLFHSSNTRHPGMNALDLLPIASWRKHQIDFRLSGTTQQSRVIHVVADHGCQSAVGRGNGTNLAIALNKERFLEYRHEVGLEVLFDDLAIGRDEDGFILVSPG